MDEIIKGDTTIRYSQISKSNELNQFIKLLTDQIAQLENEIVISSPDLVTRDLDGQFVELNQEIDIETEAVLEGKDFTFGNNVVVQDYQKGLRKIIMDKFFDVTVKFTSNELTQAVEGKQVKVLESMRKALRQKIDTYVAGILKNRTTGFVGTAGTTPTALSTLTAVERMLAVSNAPDMNRNGVMDHYMKEKMLLLDEFKNMQYTGSTAGLVNASLGKKYTLDLYSTNNIPTHTAGTFATGDTTFAVTADGANNSVNTERIPYSVLVITAEDGATSASKTLLEGDLLTYTDDNNVVRQGVVLENAVANGSGVITVKVSKPMPASTTVTAKALTFADHTAGASVRNLFWQKAGIQVVARPIQPYPDKLSISMKTTEGYPLRMSWGSDLNTKTTMLSMDCAVKGVVILPELITTALG